MIKRPFALVQILAVAFVLTKVTQNASFAPDHQIAVTISIALISVAWAALSGMAWDMLKGGRNVEK